MVAALRHRGPDDEGVHVDSGTQVAIGATRLSIIDVAGGHQPLSNEDGTVWAVLNGEIYNHPQLQRQLKEAGHRMSSRCDTEVLVHLYEEYGSEMVSGLDGMFAFAILDLRKRSVLLARDRFGEKPLFMTGEGPLAFASEIVALTRAGLGGGIDPGAVREYLERSYICGPRTIVEGIIQLLPGHTLEMDCATGRRTVRRYWRPPGYNAGSLGVNPRTAVAEAKQLLEQSVRSRLISDVPLGVFLSGGVDSTLIASMAAACTDAPVRTYTVGYEVGAFNEFDAARKSADAISSIHTEVMIRDNDVIPLFDDLMGKMDQPIADQALLASYAVSKRARQDVKVVVGGEGADEIFVGYPRYLWLRRGEDVRHRAGAALRYGEALALRAPSPRIRARADALLGHGTLMQRNQAWLTGDRAPEVAKVLGPRLVGVGPQIRTHEDGLPAGIPGILNFDQVEWLPHDVLAKADRSSMLASLEVRTPYLSAQVAEFAAAVPIGLHMRAGGKYLLRSVLAQMMSARFARQPKTAFRVPAAKWLAGPLAGRLKSEANDGPMVRDGWVDGGVLGTTITEHMCGHADRSDILWPLLCLGTWMRRFKAGG